MTQPPAFLLEDDGGEQHVFPGSAPAFICFVKEDCPTCNDVMPLIESAYRELGGKVDFFVCGQTREGNRTLVERHGLTVPILDDSSLKVSFAWDVEIVPTLCVADVKGDSSHNLVGFVRDEWRRAVDELARTVGTGEPRIDWPAFPEWRAGCGSLSVDPTIAARLQAESENSPLRARRIDIAPHDDEFEFMFDQGFSDGMPLIPPSPERVMRMLGGTTRDPQEVIATVPPNMGDATVEKVAINAVMAGCRPDYLPVVLTGLEAVCTDEFNIHGVMATTMGASPVMVVNGPIRHRLGMNMKLGALGQGNRANATIGRALRLAIRNIGGAKPGGTERSTLGNPMKFSMCFAEWEERSPWPPLHVERGFEPEDSVLTVYAMSSGPVLSVDQDSRSAGQLAGSLGLCLRKHAAPQGLPVGRNAPGHRSASTSIPWPATVTARTRSARAYRRSPRSRYGNWSRTTGPPWDSSAPWPGRWTMRPWTGKCRNFRSGSDIHIVVAGSEAGSFSAAFHGWLSGETGSMPVSRKILQ